MISGLPWGIALISGVNTYLPLFMLALFARFSHAVHLSPRFEFLASDQALVVLGLLAACEILVQKFPGLDNVWDFLHTLLRPIAGAMAAGAAVDTDRAFEMVVAMLMGGTLAAAAHSAKSGVRLVSTTKGFGFANIALSFAEDVAVVAGTLLSVYAPWVMLGVVILFVLLFVLIGPRLVRTLLFDLRMMAGWLSWARGRFFHNLEPQRVEESLLEIEPHHLKSLTTQLESGEELLGALVGWQKSRGGPRPSYWLLTTRHLLIIEQRMFRSPKVETLAYRDLPVARFRNLGFVSRVELLTHRNQNYTLNMLRIHGPFGAMAVRRISELSGFSESVDRPKTATARLEPNDEKPSLDVDFTKPYLAKKYNIN